MPATPQIKGFFWRCHMCGWHLRKKSPGRPKRTCPNCGCRFPRDEKYWLPAPHVTREGKLP